MKIKVTNCARCGKNHEDLEFTPFTEQDEAPVSRTGNTLTHFGTCPTYNEPILMRIVEDFD